MNELSILNRLSVYIQFEHPNQMLEITIKISDTFVVFLDIKDTARNHQQIRNIYIFLMMYSLINKNLLLFPRLFTSLEVIRIALKDAIKLVQDNKTILSTSSAQLHMQFAQFHSENSHIFTDENILLSTIVESPIDFKDSFERSVIRIANDYLEF